MNKFGTVVCGAAIYAAGIWTGKLITLAAAIKAVMKEREEKEKPTTYFKEETED